MNKNPNNVQFNPKKPQIPLPGLPCVSLNKPAVPSVPVKPVIIPPENPPEETIRFQRRINHNVNSKLSFERIDELTRPSANSESSAEKSESKTGLGTKFIIRDNQDTPLPDTLPKKFILNLPEWSHLSDILTAEPQVDSAQESTPPVQHSKTESDIKSDTETENISDTETTNINNINTENTETNSSIQITVIQNTEPVRHQAVELPEILAARELKKSYKKGKLTIPVLCGVDFTVGKSEFISVAGQSGSGKSTFLHLLGTLDKPDSGSIFLEKQRIDILPRQQRDIIRNRSIGFIFQFYHLLPELTTLENVLSPLMIREGFWGYLRKRKSFIEQGKEILNLVGLSHRLNHKPNELSGGEMQRAAIARALVVSPKVLLADEPTGNLDSKSAGEIIGILQKLNQEQGLTIVMITHDNIIAKAADRMVRMVDGVIVNEETAHLEERLLHHSS